MRRRLGLGIVVVALVLPGCAGRSRASEPPAPAPARGPSPPPVESLSRAMLGTNVAGLADGEAIDRLFEAPEVTAAGGRLLERLGQDASLEPLYTDFTARMFEQPALLAAMTKLAAADPGGSVESLVSTALARLSTGIDGPAFDTALDRALDRLLDRPTVDAAFGRMAERLVERSRLSERLAALLLQWQPELEAAVGVPMSDERFPSRLEQHMSDPARASAIQALFADRMVDDAGVREGLAALIDDAAFLAACTRVVHALLGGPDVHERSAAVFAGMIDEVDAGELTARVERVLLGPELEAAVVAWTEDVTACASFGTLAERLGAVLDDPNLQAELLAIVAGTAGQRTA